MGAMASQITSLTSVYSTVYSGADERKYQSSASLVFVRGIHRWPVNSPHKRPVTRKMFPFDDDVIMFVIPNGSRLWMTLLINSVVHSRIKVLLVCYIMIFVMIYSTKWTDIEYFKSNKRLRKRFKNYKPFWNDELTTLWTSMWGLEKQFHRCKDKRVKSKYQMKFRDVRYRFDKYLRRTEQQYNRQFTEQIEELNDKDPREFGDYISKQGPKKNEDIPFQIHGGHNGEILAVKESVLGKCKMSLVNCTVNWLHGIPSQLVSSTNSRTKT